MRVLFEPDPTTLAAAFRLRERVFVTEQGVPLELERDALDASAHHVVLMDGGAAIATGRVRLVETVVAKVERVAVDRERRGSGVGRAVMAALEDRARELGATAVRLAAQESAIGFYERLGYTAYDERFWDAGILHRWMRKALREREAQQARGATTRSEVRGRGVAAAARVTRERSHGDGEGSRR